MRQVSAQIGTASVFLTVSRFASKRLVGERFTAHTGRAGVSFIVYVDNQ